MNATNTTAGGYVSSAMYTTVLPVVLSNLRAAFGSSHIIKRRALLSNAINGNSASGWAWYDSYVELMSEPEIYGHPVAGNTANDIWSNGYNLGTDYTQLALFQLNPALVTTRTWYWLRAVYLSTSFCDVDGYGSAGSIAASGVYGVRPRFQIALPVPPRWVFLIIAQRGE